MKKVITLALCVAVLILSCAALFGCNTKETKIVFLGDSIAEGILGPSPLSERDNYAYAAVLGKRNAYTYINRANSGHKTGNMLAFLNKEDDGATMSKTHIMSADIIHVSILGNDMLQSNVSGLLLDMLNEEMTRLNEILAYSRTNFAKIVEKLKELNPNAVLMFQNVYNPIYPESTMIDAKTRTALTEMGIAENEYRACGGRLLQLLNNVSVEYLEEHPDAFYIIDASAEFGRVSDEDEMRGRKLIYPDGVHPSNEGHAVMADLIQTKLEELGLANQSQALKNYKKMRIGMIKEMFPDVDYRAVKKSINNADSCAEVTNRYFRAIDGQTPIYG